MSTRDNPSHAPDPAEERFEEEDEFPRDGNAFLEIYLEDTELDGAAENELEDEEILELEEEIEDAYWTAERERRRRFHLASDDDTESPSRRRPHHHH